MKRNKIYFLLLSLFLFFTQTEAQNWEYIDSGYDYDLMDFDFPQAQDKVGFAVGKINGENSNGIILKTMESGQSWFQLSPDTIPPLLACSFPSLAVGYVCGAGGYLIKTSDGGSVWDTLLIGQEVDYLSNVEFRNVNTGFVTSMNKVFFTADGGENWVEASGINTSIQDACYADGEVIYLAGNHIVQKSINGGESFFTVFNNSQDSLLGIDFLTQDFGIAVGNHGRIHKTIDGGSTWLMNNSIGDLLLKSVFSWDMDTSYVVGSPELVYKTTDGGLNWFSDFSGGGESSLNQVNFKDNYFGFICGSQGLTLRKEGFPALPLIVIAPLFLKFDTVAWGDTAHKNLLVKNIGNTTLHVSNIASDNEVFLAKPKQFNLEPFEQELVDVAFFPSGNNYFSGNLFLYSDDTAHNPKLIPVAGWGTNSVIIDENGANDIFYIGPNPFNQEIVIEWNALKTEIYEIMVYDLTGEIIQLEKMHCKERQTFSYTWNGHNMKGEPVAKGIYLLTIKNGEHRTSFKIIHY